MKRVIFSLAFACSAWFCQAQEPDTARLLSSTEVAAQFNESQFNKSSGGPTPLSKLRSAMALKKFTPRTGSADYWGTESISTTKDAKGAVKKVKQSVYLQNYGNAKSADKAALAKIVITADGQNYEYNFYLVAPKGNFNSASEYFLDSATQKVKMVGKSFLGSAPGWWRCVKRNLATCNSGCKSSLVSCLSTGNWVGYLLCVSRRCGGCYLKKLACCACNCHWYCKWAVGCCNR